jgi:protein-tyrosine phosphatase
MGNSNSSLENKSISIIKTDGPQITGISMFYNKDDEAKIIAKIQETLNMQTEQEDSSGLNKIKEILDTNTEEYTGYENKNLRSNVEKDLISIQEQDEQEPEEVKLDPKLEKVLEELDNTNTNDNDMKIMIEKLEDKLAEKTETFNSSV